MTHETPPDQAATEAAVAYLLGESIVAIRFSAAPLLPDQSIEALIARRDQIHLLADICHDLPGYLAPDKRHHLVQELRWLWTGSSARKRRWIRSCWDRLGYDYSWLLDEEDLDDAEATHGT